MIEENNTLKSPFELFGIECDEGWKKLYQPLIGYIDKYNSEHDDSKIIIDQIKEKFGCLRFYVTYDNVPKEIIEELNNMISDAETESYCVCEMCGTKENVGMTQGWLQTICPTCLFDTMKFVKEKVWKRNSDGTVFVVKRFDNMTDYKNSVKKD